MMVAFKVILLIGLAIAALCAFGSKEEKEVRVFCYSCGIDYDHLSDMEIMILCGILNKSKHLRNRESRRGKGKKKSK